MSKIYGSEGLKFYDKTTANKHDAILWDDGINSVEKLRDSDFAITIPIELAYSQDKLNFIKKYISLIKPIDSNYVVLPKLSISEYKKAFSNARLKTKVNILDTSNQSSNVDNLKINFTTQTEKVYNISNIYCYDDGMWSYDDPDSSVTYDADNIVRDYNSIVMRDFASLKLISK